MLRLGLIVAITVAFSDQASKLYFYRYLVEGGRRVVEVLPFFNLVTVWNYGISFGLFNSDSRIGGAVFVVLAAVIVVGLLLWLRRVASAQTAAALGLVIGGALGNIVDRLRFGAVFDFLDFHAFGWHWPAFNLADSAITVGAAALLIETLFGGGRSIK